MNNLNDLIINGDFSSFFELFKGNQSKDKILTIFNKYRNRFGLEPLEILSDSDNIQGGKGDEKSIEDLINIYVEKLNKPYDIVAKVINKQIQMGIQTEMEHTNSEELAKEIAIDHITENPLYYSKLKKSGLADELKENSDNPIEYGCLMLDVNIKNWQELLDRIDDNDVYDEIGFGKENEPHITVLYGFHDDVNVDDIISDVKSLKEPIQFSFKSASLFSNDEYDVLKFDIESDELIKLNKHFKDNYDNTSTFPTYHPHLTIAYLKAGTGEKYVFDLKQSIEGKSKKFTYSTVDKQKHNIELDLNEIKIPGAMPNSSLVQVKKKCALGGNGDGTSEPCNQGDINNIVLTKINEIKKRKEKNKSIVMHRPIYYGVGAYNYDGVSDGVNDGVSDGGGDGGMEEAYKYNQIDDDEDAATVYGFKTKNDLKYVVKFSKRHNFGKSGDNTYLASFFTVKNGSRNYSQLENTPDRISILSTIQNIIKDFIDKNNKPSIVYSPDASRSKHRAAKTRIYDEWFNKMNYSTNDLGQGYYMASPKVEQSNNNVDINEVEDNSETIYYTGRGKKFNNLNQTRGEFIFFTKNPKIAEWYGGDDSNVSKAKLDTTNFLDLTNQNKKIDFVNNFFTNEDILELYPNIKRIAFNDRDVRISHEEKLKKLINEYKEDRLLENSFTGGIEQQFLLKKIKSLGYGGVKLLDTHFGKSDISYVVIDKSIITTINDNNIDNTIDGVNINEVELDVIENKDVNKIEKEYGYFTISPKLSNDNELFVTHLEINPESRNKGLFKSLFNDIVEYTKENNKDTIILEPDITKGVDYFNKLVNLYKKIGFVEVEDDPSLLKYLI
jgi:2'-5' RNA ligase/GNAT superfamily N-acetyltransferase